MRMLSGMRGGACSAQNSAGWQAQPSASPQPHGFEQSCLRLWRHVSRRKRGALAEEVIVHLFDDKFLRLRSAQVQAILVHDHLHVLKPHAPPFFGDIFIDLLAQRMSVERNFAEARHLFLEFHTEHLPACGLDARRKWRTSTTTTHTLSPFP